MRSRFTLTIIILMLPCAAAHAEELCERQNLGWHFYCDPKQERIISGLTKEQESQVAKAELAEVKQKLEDLKVTAIMRPSIENVKNYIAFQQEQINRAAFFSRQWQQALWQNPELDYTVKTPISTIGNEARAEVRQKDIAEVLSKAKERYGLFFFYSSQCSFCHKFSPIIKAFVDHYRLEAMAISMDGGILLEWPSAVVNHGQAERLGMSAKPVPAVVLFDNQTKRVLTVGFGILTFDELENRVSTLVKAAEQIQEEKHE